jgi:hypothetical protein
MAIEWMQRRIEWMKEKERDEESNYLMHREIEWMQRAIERK